MKTTFSLFAALVGLTTAAADGSNVTISTSAHDAHEAMECLPPPGGLDHWFYNSRTNGPYQCNAINDKNKWTMMNAYRSGGVQGVHWKYTTNENDPECMKDWKYYADDGVTLLTDIVGRITNAWDPHTWCALPVYRPGGALGKQWSYCDCTSATNRPGRE